MIELTQYEFGEAFYDKHRLKTRSFFDDYLIDTENTTVETRLCKPVEKEVVLKLDKPWEIGCSYVHFFYDNGKYRMYYVAHNYQEMVKAKEGDSIEKPIGFEEDLSTFSGKEVTMTVRMYDADLYSVQFSKERG